MHRFLIYFIILSYVSFLSLFLFPYIKMFNAFVAGFHIILKKFAFIFLPIIELYGVIITYLYCVSNTYFTWKHSLLQHQVFFATKGIKGFEISLFSECRKGVLMTKNHTFFKLFNIYVIFFSHFFMSYCCTCLILIFLNIFIDLKDKR